MNSIIIDTNPLAYIYNMVPDFGEKYAVLLEELAGNNTLLIPKIVYGELSLIFYDSKELKAFISDTGIVIDEIESETYIIAAERWEKYNKNRVLMCSRCGKKIEKLICENCSCEIRIRQHILSDFLIGAHAFQTGDRKIVTHDAGYYSTYFPELDIISIK
jgi:predicted nucleic acid-binding protein